MSEKIVNNYNMLQGHKYKLSIKRAKNFEYFCKQIAFPGVSLTPTNQPTPFKNIPQYGDHIEYDNLAIKFAIDEDMNNYFEIKNWLCDLSNNKSFNQFKELKDKNKSYEDNGVYSEISLMILKNSGNTNKIITFNRAFPINLSGFDFDIDVDSTEVRTAIAHFSFVDYQIEDV
jgi:hypothetical protein